MPYLTEEELKELASKINWEGGVAEYFTSYTYPEEFQGTQLYEPAKKLVEAIKELESILPDLEDDEEY